MRFASGTAAICQWLGCRTSGCLGHWDFESTPSIDMIIYIIHTHTYIYIILYMYIYYIHIDMHVLKKECLKMAHRKKMGRASRVDPTRCTTPGLCDLKSDIWCWRQCRIWTGCLFGIFLDQGFAYNWNDSLYSSINAYIWWNQTLVVWD